MTQLLKFKPLYQQRVWGGHSLESWLGRRHVIAGPVGESWEIVDRPEAQSVVCGGPRDGRKLRQLVEQETAWLMGPAWNPARPFPILVKWLDCRERLSLQVHPPAGVAASLGGEPKTENWYFARTDAAAAVIAGLRAGVTIDDFERALADGTAEQCMARQAVHAGDSLLIRSGLMHAIDAGNVILEIQQNSDTTYRVYDWGRVGLDGKPRALHVRESLASLRAATDLPPAELLRGPVATGVLAECAEFRIRRVVLAAGEELTVRAGEEARILSVVGGRLADAADGAALKLGDNVLLPFGADFVFKAPEASVLLLTEKFG